MPSPSISRTLSLSFVVEARERLASERAIFATELLFGAKVSCVLVFPPPCALQRAERLQT